MAFSGVLLTLYYSLIFWSNPTSLPHILYDLPLCCNIVVVEPFPVMCLFCLIFRLLIGQRDFTLRGYIATSWFGVRFTRSFLNQKLKKNTQCVQNTHVHVNKPKETAKGSTSVIKVYANIKEGVYFLACRYKPCPVCALLYCNENTHTLRLSISLCALGCQKTPLTNMCWKTWLQCSF